MRPSGWAPHWLDPGSCCRSRRFRPTFDPQRAGAQTPPKPPHKPGDEAAMPAKPRVITIEEHYQDPDVVRAYAPEDARQVPAIAERLNDLTSLRIREMDEAGIDMQG